MKWRDITITNRPPFMLLVEETSQPYINGYTLLVDVDTKQASIINLKKGGNLTMLKEIRIARAGFEGIVEILEQKKANLEVEKAAAIEKAVAEVELKFKDDADYIEKLFNDATYVEEIEVPDEEPVVEEPVADEPVEAEENIIGG